VAQPLPGHRPSTRRESPIRPATWSIPSPNRCPRWG
jgi:hypothetical protein